MSIQSPQECPEGRWTRCSSGQCVSKWRLCNGRNDCTDGSDEATETCGVNCDKVGGRFACSDGQCIGDR